MPYALPNPVTAALLLAARAMTMRLMELDCNDIDHTFIKRTKPAWPAAAAFSAGPSISLSTCLRCCCRALNKGAQTQTGDRTTRQAPAPGRWRNLNACIALLAPVLTLAGCIGPTLLSSQRSITVESLEGNYRRLIGRMDDCELLIHPIRTESRLISIPAPANIGISHS